MCVCVFPTRFALKVKCVITDGLSPVICRFVCVE